MYRLQQMVCLLNRAIKEMRYAYRVFNEYRGIRKISIFGSARTPEAHTDYQTAKAFSAAGSTSLKYQAQPYMRS